MHADRCPSNTSSSVRRRRLTSVATVAVVATITSGCITGERPTLVSTAATADPAVAAVLTRLDSADAGAFTATYEITPTRSSAETVEATIRQSGRDDRDVTVGAVEYHVRGAQTETCVDGTCESGLNDARVSDLNLTHRFWGDAFAARLRNDDARKLAPAAARTETIATFPAVCAEVPVVGGQTVYCALDEGVLARYRGADVVIELTSFSRPAQSGVDE